MPNEVIASVDVGSGTIEVVRGDITVEDVDAVVNAANDRLQHGGGVAAAIVDAGGEVIQEESDAWVADHGRLRDGEAAVTTAGELPAGSVIHVAGPVYDEASDQNEPRLRAAVTAALETAAEIGAGSVALPAISTGVYGYPRDEATRLIVDEAARHLGERSEPVRVRIVAFDEGTAADLREALSGIG